MCNEWKAKRSIFELFVTRENAAVVIHLVVSDIRPNVLPQLEHTDRQILSVCML